MYGVAPQWLHPAVKYNRPVITLTTCHTVDLGQHKLETRIDAAQTVVKYVRCRHACLKSLISFRLIISRVTRCFISPVVLCSLLEYMDNCMVT